MVKKRICTHCANVTHDSSMFCPACGSINTKRELEEDEGLVMLDPEFNFDYFFFISLADGMRQLAIRLHDPKIDALSVVLSRKEHDAAKNPQKDVRLAGMSFTKKRLTDIVCILDEVAPELDVNPEFEAVGLFRENIRSNGMNKVPALDLVAVPA